MATAAGSPVLALVYCCQKNTAPPASTMRTRMPSHQATLDLDGREAVVCPEGGPPAPEFSLLMSPPEFPAARLHSGLPNYCASSRGPARHIYQQRKMLTLRHLRGLRPTWRQAPFRTNNTRSR